MTESHVVPATNRWVVAISVMFATFMEVLDTTVVNVSLPHIAGSLSATIDESTWALTSYLVANAVVLPLTGWLANHFGRKRLLMASIAGFTVSSLLCGLAPNLMALVAFRIIQGLTGGALQPLSQAVLLEAFPPHERGKAMGFWGLGVVVAPILGPVLGGWLTDSYSWRWVFYINLPVGAISLLMVRRYVFDPSYIRRSTQGVDYTGIALLVVGIGALQYVLDKGQEDDWFESRTIAVLAISSAVALTWFVVNELRDRHPVVNLRILAQRTFGTGVFLMTTLGFVLFGSLVLLPIMLQTLLGYPSLQAGIAMAPRGLGALIMMPIVGAITGRVDPRKLVGCGLIIGATTLYWLGSLNLQAGYWEIFWPQLIQGFGMSLLFVPLTTISMSQIPREQMGNATSIFNLMRNLGGSMGIAAAATLLARTQQTHFHVLGAHIDAFDPAVQQRMEHLRSLFIASGADVVTAGQRAYAAMFGLVQRQATMQAFVDVFRLFAGVFLLVLPLVFAMKRPSKHAGPTTAH
ncbi:MAG: DHA2 family efflux MFS transporter permease subunit [Vicinamibacterales bacterium]